MSQLFFSGKSLQWACPCTLKCCPGMALGQVQHTLWVDYDDKGKEEEEEEEEEKEFFARQNF